MNWYAQTDPRWAKELLGFNTDPTYDIGNYGCVVTAVANLHSAATGDTNLTPATINSWGIANGGFVNEKDTGTWIWPATARIAGVTAQGTSQTLSVVNQFLASPPNFAILEVNNGRHFVLANLTNTIIDSEDGKQKSIKTYPFVMAHLYTAISLPVVAPAPVQALPVTPYGVSYNPVDATVEIRSALNARVRPNTDSDNPPVATFHPGTAHIRGWLIGQNVTVAGRTDDVWLVDDNWRVFAQAGTTYHQ